MAPPEVQIHSFIIKFWLEPGEKAWRGYIIHVPSNERRYLKSLACIGGFIEPYLRDRGGRIGWWRRLRGRWH